MGLPSEYRSLNEMKADLAEPNPGSPREVEIDIEPSRRIRTYVKRTFDVVTSAVLLVALSPLMLLISLGIVIDSGQPIFFCQERLGLHGNVFRMIKFRTMRPGSDRTTPLNEDGSLRTDECDPRITRAGRILRRLSLDELPQLLNVLKGEMSLVGPRPDLPFHARFYTEVERHKLAARPGITGLAQISGRNEIPWKERISYDLAYIENQSLVLDLKILAVTIARVVRSEGIYQSRVRSHQNRSLKS